METCLTRFQQGHRRRAIFTHDESAVKLKVKNGNSTVFLFSQRSARVGIDNMIMKRESRV